MPISTSLKVVFVTSAFVLFASCSYHAYTKKEALQVAKKVANKKDMRIVIEDSGSIVKVLVRDSNYKKLDEIYHFDENGNQLNYTLIASCDSCFKKNVSSIIASNMYKWQKLTDSTYLSRYRLKSILNIHKSRYTYEIVPHHYSQQEYKSLLKNVVQ